MKAFTFAAAAGLLAIGLTGASVAGEVKAPTMLSDAQMDQMVAGRTMELYYNTEDGEYVLKPYPQGNPGGVDHSPGWEGNGNWSGPYGTCETNDGSCDTLIATDPYNTI